MPWQPDWADMVMMPNTTGNPEGISGESLREMLERLKAERTVLHVISAERRYERLALITQIDATGGGGNLLLSPPPGFPDDLKRFPSGHIEVQYLGRDQMPYSFESEVVERSSGSLWVEPPARIEGSRRRRYARVTPPVRTAVRFVTHGESIAATVANLGAGGALILLDVPLRGDLRVRSGAVLDDLRVSCAAKTLRFQITVRKSLVKRGQGEMQPDFFSVALQFLEMHPRSRHRLEDAISSYRQAELSKSSA